MALKDHLSGGNVMEVLKISLPLILASAGHTINLFADRVMLARYSQDAVGASFVAGLTSFTLISFFMGTVGYANAFVAQYYGAENHARVGAAVWQGVFLALFGGAILAGGWFWAEPLFACFGHAPGVTRQEVAYYQVLSLGAVLPLLQCGLAVFWSGRGKTMMVMAVNFLVTAINVPCNYLLIYGKQLPGTPFGDLAIPELGIAGAAWGTNIAGAAGTLTMLLFFLLPREAREKYGTTARVWDWELFKRLLRFGTPNGASFFIDIAAFNIYAVILGTFGAAVQEATSIAFAVNSLAFMPIIGIGTTVSVMVGHAVGAANIPQAERSVKSARLLALSYMALMAVLFVAVPDAVLWFFVRPDDPEQVAALDYARKFLLFIAAYLLFDGINIIYNSAIKGAGDTKFSMWAVVVICWAFFALPCLLYHWLFPREFWGLWAILVINVVIYSFTFYFRYHGGKWKKMRVIE